MTPILEVENLEIGFGAKTVLHGVDFSVAEGEVAVLLGLNGAGKSVTLKSISGLLKPWRGDVRLRGTSILKLPPEQRVRHGLAHVPQNRAVFPQLTVDQNLRLGGYVIRDKGELKRALGRVYEVFPVLGERRKQRAGTMSGGEQGMLAVGRALMSSPSLILVDEPSAGLSPAAIRGIFDVIKQVNEAGMTILLVEQNVTFALEIADRVMLMQQGGIALDSPLDGLPDPARLLDLLGVGAVYGPVVRKVLKERGVTTKPVRKPAATSTA